MFGLFKKKSEAEKIQEKYKKLMAEAHKLSTIDRAKSDAKFAEAEELINLSKEFSTNIMVGHLMLFHPAIQKIKKLIDEKKIGKLSYIYSNRINFKH